MPNPSPIDRLIEIMAALRTPGSGCPWDLEQDFKRVDKLLSIGLDDILEVSVPWSLHPDVEVRDSQDGDTLFREYDTPAGVLRHMVLKTDEDQGPGWVIQLPATTFNR